VKIINRYVLKEHVGPFVFALSALTSLLLLQYIARKFGDLVGRGLSWQVIGEFFLLSIPFTVAMTLPMSILVSVLYAFSRLAAENEVTALKAGGVSARSLMKPALIASTFLALFMLWFNDQLLPQANHELAALQMAIFRTKPTFALKPQVINTVKEGQFYLRAGSIAEDRTGRMRDVTIYDVSDANRRRTIYADSGTLGFAENRRDLMMTLYDGMMLSSPSNQSEQVNRIYYKQDHLLVRDIANSFQPIDADTAMKGEREMSICEMQKEYDRATARVWRAREDSIRTAWRVADEQTPAKHLKEPQRTTPPKAGGIGALYCTMVQQTFQKYYNKYFKVREAHAADLSSFAHAARQDSTKPARQDSTKPPRQDTTKSAPPKTQIPAVPPQRPNSAYVNWGGQYLKVPVDKLPNTTIPVTPSATPPVAGNAVPAQAPTPTVMPPPAQPQAVSPATASPSTAAPQTPVSASTIELNDARMRIEQARHERNRYGVEIQKKFSLAAACIVLVLVGAPLALRFPSGGVGLVFGVSFFVFAIYYVGLIGGEALSDKDIISPFWAMWADNFIFSLVGLALMTRMGHEGVTSRGGGIGEALASIRARFSRGRAPAEITPAAQSSS
jgi:lipopolysaccharide export system permease protein